LTVDWGDKQLLFFAPSAQRNKQLSCRRESDPAMGLYSLAVATHLLSHKNNTSARGGDDQASDEVLSRIARSLALHSLHTCTQFASLSFCLSYDAQRCQMCEFRRAPAPAWPSPNELMTAHPPPGMAPRARPGAPVPSVLLEVE
jgi:hypothetical protein